MYKAAGLLCIISVASCLDAGQWAASGTVILKKSFVLTRAEAEEMAVKKRRLQLELEFQRKRVEFFKELSEDAKSLALYHKDKANDYRSKWLDAENRQFKRTTRKNFLSEFFIGVGKVLLMNQAVKQIKF